MKAENRPLTHQEGLEILRILKEVNSDLRRVSRAVFGDKKPEKSDGKFDEFAVFGHNIASKAAANEKQIDKLEAAIRGGVSHAGD